MGFFDVSRAHFHSPARRLLVVRVPKEDTTVGTGVAGLTKAMYGTKDAAQCFDAKCESVFEKLKYRVGEYNPCLHFNLASKLITRVHRDDFVIVGSRQASIDFKKSWSRDSRLNLR